MAMKKVAVLLTALCFVPAAAGLRAQGKSTIVERVLVRVNGEIFTQSQLTQRQIAALRDMEKEKRDDSKLGETVASITPELLVTAVDELLLVQRGREMIIAEHYSTDDSALARANEIWQTYRELGWTEPMH